MPDKKGQLSKDENEKIIQWMKLNWVDWKCPYCKNTTWELGTTLAHISGFDGNNVIIAGTVYPFAVANCKKCGNTVLINAVKIGIVANKEANGEKE